MKILKRILPIGNGGHAILLDRVLMENLKASDYDYVDISSVEKASKKDIKELKKYVNTKNKNIK